MRSIHHKNHLVKWTADTSRSLLQGMAPEKLIDEL
jgi:hypothetical protein